MEPLTPKEMFFYEHAGYSYLPGESPVDGRHRCARELSAAEDEMRSESHSSYVEWVIDPDITSHDWEDKSEPERSTHLAILYYGEQVVGTLGGIDLRGPTDPYVRVIEAELWQDFSAEREKCVVRGEN